MRKAAALAIVLLALATTATAAPMKVSTIHRIYPDLAAREMARQPVSWSHLRKMAASRWRGTHPCQRATLDHTARFAGYWPAVHATWNCDDVPAWKQSFLMCVPHYEGQFIHPDVRFGGATGDPTGLGLGNVVMTPWQFRPGWIQGYLADGVPGRYGADEWTHAAYRFALSPVNMARLGAALQTREWGSTATKCGY